MVMRPIEVAMMNASGRQQLLKDWCCETVEEEAVGFFSAEIFAIFGENFGIFFFIVQFRLFFGSNFAKISIWKNWIKKKKQNTEEEARNHGRNSGSWTTCLLLLPWQPAHATAAASLPARPSHPLPSCTPPLPSLLLCLLLLALFTISSVAFVTGLLWPATSI